MSDFVKVDGSTTVAEVMTELRDMGVVSDAAADRVIAAHGSRDVECKFEIEASDLVEKADDDVLLDELRDRGVSVDVDPHAIADGIRYARAGQPILAEAMFARQLPDMDMSPLFSALRQ